MALSDMLEAMDNPEGYITRQVRQQEGEERQQLRENIFGAGYTGREIRGIPQGRGIFGSMLQGLGIIGQPEPRPLTPFEEFLYQKGQLEKESTTNLTERQNIEKVHGAVNVIQDAIASGHLPSEMSEMMKYLPPSMQGSGGFERQSKERQEGVEYTTKKRAYDLRQEQDVSDLNALRLRDYQGLAGRRAMTSFKTIINTVTAAPKVKEYTKLYLEKKAEAEKEALENNDLEAAGLKLAQANGIYALLVDAIATNMAMLGQGEGAADMVYYLVGDPPGGAMMDVMAGPKVGANPENIIQTGPEIEQFYQSEGFYTPVPSGTPAPTPTPGRP